MSYQQQIIKGIFKNQDVDDQPDGLRVYRNNFIETGIRALAISFPTLAYFLEQADFRALSRAYLLEHPKTQFDWADYGESFAGFILSHPNLVELPYLSEVAELDWHLQCLERSSDKAFNGDSFALLNVHEHSSLRFDLAPGFRLLKCFFPVGQLHRLASDKELAEEGPLRAEFMQNLNKLMSDAIKSEEPRSVLIWRPDYKAEILTLAVPEQQLFEKLGSQETVADIFAHFDDSPDELSAWLSEQIMQKRIYGVSLIP